MFITYIIQSQKSERYYIGHTQDILIRLSYHNNGKVKATKNKGPWVLVYFEEYETKLEANRRELEIKAKKSRKYIEALINKISESSSVGRARPCQGRGREFESRLSLHIPSKTEGIFFEKAIFLFSFKVAMVRPRLWVQVDSRHKFL